MRSLSIAIALLLSCLTPSLAAAEPTAKQLEARATALRERLDGHGFVVVIEPPFVVIGDMGKAATERIATGFLRSKIKLLEEEYFSKRPTKLLEIWLFKDAKAFKKGAKKFFDDTPDTPFGYYSPEAGALIMNASGLGTLSHELVHPYIEANFPDAPAWFNEGLASLYEGPSVRKGRIIGVVNWRLPNLQKEIRARTLPPLAKLVATKRDEFYEARYDAYAMARYLMYYLQERGKLKTFYEQFRDNRKDLTGAATLEAVLGEDLATFEPKWRKFVLGLRR
jgi:hypothetical protein